jgi:dTDP-4-dehydrorhamnose 3,5-epimerase
MDKRLRISETPLPGLKLIERRVMGDARGYLERLFCANELQSLIGARSIVQINHTLTARRGAVRGMHFQHPPHAEIKFVTCLRGEVFDVAVDLRRDSSTRLRWHAELLSAGNHRTLLVPEGFAHGFQTLTEDCELLYFHTSAYDEQAEAGLNANDPMLDILWPLPIAELSNRDASHPMITAAFSGVSL